MSDEILFQDGILDSTDLLANVASFAVSVPSEDINRILGNSLHQAGLLRRASRLRGAELLIDEEFREFGSARQ